MTTHQSRDFEDVDVLRWAERHGLDVGTFTDMKCAFEDAFSLGSLASQPAGGAVGEAKRQALNTCVEWVRSRKYAFTADEMLKEVSALLISDPAKEH